MTAIRIIKDNDGKVSLQYEEKTQENVKKRIEQLREALNIDLYGVCAIFGMKPNEGNTRTIRRWYHDPSASTYREMPENSWKLLLALTEGQEKV